MLRGRLPPFPRTERATGRSTRLQKNRVNFCKRWKTAGVTLSTAPLRAAFLPQTTARGTEGLGSRFHPNLRGGVWARGLDHSRNRAILSTSRSRSDRRTRCRTTGCIYKKRANSFLEFTVLQFAGAWEACDVPVRWSCRTGVCHTCESALIGGAVQYQPDPLEPPATGNVLICCSRPVADIEVDL